MEEAAAGPEASRAKGQQGQEPEFSSSHRGSGLVQQLPTEDIVTEGLSPASRSAAGAVTATPAHAEVSKSSSGSITQESAEPATAAGGLAAIGAERIPAAAAAASAAAHSAPAVGGGPVLLNSCPGQDSQLDGSLNGSAACGSTQIPLYCQEYTDLDGIFHRLKPAVSLFKSRLRFVAGSHIEFLQAGTDTHGNHAWCCTFSLISHHGSCRKTFMDTFSLPAMDGEGNIVSPCM